MNDREEYSLEPPAKKRDAETNISYSILGICLEMAHGESFLVTC
jgi:hypothetical protein